LAFVGISYYYGSFFAHPDWYPVSSTVMLVQKILNGTPKETIESERATLSSLLERPIYVHSASDDTLPEIVKQLPDNGKPVYYAPGNRNGLFYAPVHGNDLIVAIDPSFNQYAPFSSLVTQFLWLAWILMVTAAGGFFLSRPIGKRLNELEAAAEKIHQGDFSARIKTITSDLVGEVGICFNQMAERIQAMVTNQQTLLSGFIGKLTTSNKLMVDHLNNLSCHRGILVKKIAAIIDDLEEFVSHLLRTEKNSGGSVASELGETSFFSDEQKDRGLPHKRNKNPQPLLHLGSLRTLTGFKSSVFQTGILKFIMRVAIGILVTLLFNHWYGIISSQVGYKYMPGIQNWYPARTLPALIQRTIDVAEIQDASTLLVDLQKSLQREIDMVDARALPSPETRLEIKSGDRITYGAYNGRNVYFAPVHGGTHTLIIENGLDLYRQRPSLLLHLGMLPLEMLLTVIGSLLFSWPIIRHLKALEKGLNGIRKGDLNSRVSIPAGRPIGNMARSFNDMANRLQLLITNRKHLIQAVGHEIRTPISRIHFYLEMITHDEDMNTITRRIEKVREEIEELNGLTEELRTFTEIEGRNYENKEVPIYNELLNILDHYEKTRLNLSFTLVGNPDDTTTIHVSPVYFRRVIQNVLSNAVRHARTRVSIRYRLIQSAVFIEICDDGPGVPPNDREVIFEPFTRLDNSRNKKTGGYGLGLAITRRILSLYHGNISVSDNTPLGAKFTIYWPLS
jgi:signal transduction histidine kinase